MKNTSLNIYNCIKALNDHSQKAYTKTIRTILRGSVGPVSNEFIGEPFFGISERIELTEIEKTLKHLCKEEKIFRVINSLNGRVHYMTKRPKESINIDDFSKLKTKKKEVEKHKDIDDMIDEMFSWFYFNNSVTVIYIKTHSQLTKSNIPRSNFKADCLCASFLINHTFTIEIILIDLTLSIQMISSLLYFNESFMSLSL